MKRRNAAVAVVFSSMMMLGTALPVKAQEGLPALPDLPGTEAGPAVPVADATLPAAPATQDPAAAATLPDAFPALPATAVAQPGVLPGTLPATQPATLPGVASATPPGTLPAAMPALPGLPGTAPATAAAPAPPALEEISVGTGDLSASAPELASESTLYSFLFVEIPEYGIVRHRFAEDVAEELKEAELTRLREQRRGGGNNQPVILGVTPMAEMGPDMMGMDMGMGDMGMGMPAQGVGMSDSAINAAAEWDFYYQQLEMYDRFVREKLIPGSDNLPELQYDASNALQERQDLFESFQEAAIVRNTEDFNTNRAFYERLAQREDRRRTYLEWLRLRQQAVQDWSEVWARKVYGTRWADGEEVRLDDWYYGVDFNSAQPVEVTIGGREYVLSRQPLTRLRDGQLNVISTNLTPYDIIDANGEMKNPVMETLRGTLVMPPAPPVYTTDPRLGAPQVVGGAGTTQVPGTIEIVGGVTTE